MLGVFGIYFDAQQAAQTPIGLFGWSLLAWGFIIFATAAFAAIIQFAIENHTLRIKRPKIKVITERDVEGTYIRVQNVEGAGLFRADIIHKSGDIVPSSNQRYQGVWERTNGPQADLYKGQDDRVIVAKWFTDSRVLGLNIYYWEPTYFANGLRGRVNWFQSTSWIPGAQGIIKPSYKMSVRISSQPPLQGHEYVADFILDLNGLHKLGSKFSIRQMFRREQLQQGISEPPF